MSGHPILELQLGMKYHRPNDESGDCLLHITKIEYDGERFDISLYARVPEDQNNLPEFNDETDLSKYEMYNDIRILGAQHANLLVCSLLALLEGYGQPNLLYDKDIQEECERMVQEAKDLYAKKAFEQICDGLQAT